VIECRDPASLTKPDEKYLIVATHSGKFHADDVMCLALVSLFSSKPVVLVRTRDENVFSKCHMVLDVGNKDFYGKHHLRLDHHQTLEDYIVNGKVKSGTKDKLYYKNGLKKATCGKLADWMFLGISNSFLDFLRSKVLYSLEAKDNGVSIIGKINRDINGNPYPLGFVSLMNPSSQECKMHGTSIATRAGFIKAEEMTKKILTRIIEEFEARENNNKILDEMIKEVSSKKVRYFINEGVPMSNLEEYIVSWNNSVSNKKRIISLMQRAFGEDDLWIVKTIAGYNIPIEWRNKDKLYLQKHSGYTSIQKVIFNLAVFSDRAEAEDFVKKLAKKK
jgi:uncharacterized UPF0160 family protein